ncbi:4'-phosphopantetheinyl transferase superfamily protein [Crenobacter sp. SG2305]|uniref:4'-phosphopantetheinyl transferase family protein n=1 Tax=Crenobacter oryzisoli TaxID=3056844 RepID=UPI0025AA5150|nr:4'-phosphopantetheinyl transferase superfamily protein [Crenobacter sp. SG2305]MDN0083039.1 4'-phosphopantetheinyl transferase superfamily protein [Crenobacter sp. SG2305]
MDRHPGGTVVALNWWLSPATLVERGVCAGWLSLPGPRPVQRVALRQLLPEALASAFGQAPGSLVLLETGAAPRLRGLAGAEWLSLSYVGGRVSFALAVRPVGIDLVEIGALPDWRAVAEDFLGPDVAAALGTLPAHERDGAFALAWAELEARGKALGEGLAEWSAGRAASLAEGELLLSVAADGHAMALVLAA